MKTIMKIHGKNTTLRMTDRAQNERRFKIVIIKFLISKYGSKKILKDEITITTLCLVDRPISTTQTGN